jgi:hypothetical protein
MTQHSSWTEASEAIIQQKLHQTAHYVRFHRGLYKALELKKLINWTFKAKAVCPNSECNHEFSVEMLDVQFNLYDFTVRIDRLKCKKCMQSNRATAWFKPSHLQFLGKHLENMLNQCKAKKKSTRRSKKTETFVLKPIKSLSKAKSDSHCEKGCTKCSQGLKHAKDMHTS